MIRLLKGITSAPDLCWPLIAKVFNRNYRVFLKTWKANLMFNFLEPILYLGAMGFGLGAYVTKVQGLSYIGFLGPGLIASSAMFAVTYEMTYGSFGRMSHQKTFHAMVATPVGMDDVVMGELLFGTFKGVLYGLVFAIVTLGFGLIKSPLALLLPIPLALMAMSFSILSMIWTSIAPNYDSFGYFFTLLISPMFLLSGVFFPVDGFPPAAQLIPWFTPIYHGVEIVRPLVLGSLNWTMAGHLAWLAVFVLLTVRIPLVMVRNRLIK
ncbi:MAG TPA: ABC transporter permease [Bacillota bacterium]|nr:ABC transporter permease [Bacillota bacterium]